MRRASKSFIGFTLLFLTLASCSERREQITAFTDVNLIPMTDERVVENQTVLVRGTRIAAIGPSNEVRIPEIAVVIDGAGAYLMPGLADMHMHTRDDWLSKDWPVCPLNLYLANGVTTIRDFGPKGKSSTYALRWREEIKKGKRSGPSIYAAGPILYGPVEDPQGIVRKQKAQGFDFVKLYSFLSRNEFQEAMAAARELGMYSAGHIPFSVGLEGVISEGMNEIAHIEELDFEFLDFDRNKKMHPKQWISYLIEASVRQYKTSFGLDIEDLKKRHEKTISAVINKLQSADIPICTTLVIGEIIVRKLFEPEAFLARPENKYLPKWYLKAFHQGKEKHQVQFRGNEDFAPLKYTLERILLGELRKAGIRLLLGTDAGTGGMGIVPGFSIHDELRILTENGFTPYEAIATGTVNASKVVKAMTGVDDFGTIEVGKRADLVLVNENPLKDVTNIQDLRGVMAAGRWYEEAELQKMITSGIPVTGVIHHIREPDNSSKTSIEVVIGGDFTGDLPDDIDSITVTVTDSDGITLPLTLPAYTYIKQFRDFWYTFDGPPAIGKYTFTVKSKGSTGNATDFQEVNRAIPLPDVSTFSPGQGEILASKAPTFSWGAVEYPDIPIYYRLVIDEFPSGKRVFSTGRVRDMLSYKLSEGLLKPGQSYRWQIRIEDSHDWVKMQNRSSSEWLTFTMAQSLER